MNLFVISLGLVILLSPVSAVAADQRLSDLFLQIQRLQQEMQELRGQLEVQQHEIATLKRQQRDQYLDIDTRLRSQAKGAPASGGQTGMAPAIGMSGAARTGEPPSDAAGDSPEVAPQPVVRDRPDLAQSQPADPAGEKAAYRSAFDQLKQRRYDEAIDAFEDLLARYPGGEFSDNARYWLGETNYVKRDYAAALTEFERVVANYPLSPKVPGAMLKIAYIEYDRSNWRRARDTLQDVVEKFPETTEARLAQSRLDRMAREGR